MARIGLLVTYRRMVSVAAVRGLAAALVIMTKNSFAMIVTFTCLAMKDLPAAIVAAILVDLARYVLRI